MDGKALLARILKREIAPEEVACFTYYPSTSWAYIGTFTFSPGLYNIYAGWNYGAPTGIGLSNSTQTSPTVILGESSTGGARTYVYTALGNDEMKFYAKCSGATTAGTNTLVVRKLISL